MFGNYFIKLTTDTYVENSVKMLKYFLEKI